ncbi:glycerophosphodiester phosphodiesterase [Burkholderiaceae bacterium UC74_6]
MISWPYPLWIAHRGAGKLAPENTLAAFRLGRSYGFKAYECDVKLSADGQPFLLHDATLERTTNGSGAAGEKSWGELSRLDAGSWHSAPYAGERLATLDEVAAYCIAEGCTVNLEIKPSPGTEIETGRVAAREAQRLWAGQVPPLLSSFQVPALLGAMETAPELPRALLLDALKPGWLEQAKNLGCVAVVTHHPLMDHDTIAAIHGAGMKAMVYTVNDAARAEELMTLRIDGLITDAVDHFKPS